MTAASTENKPHLLYFGLAGRAELARLLFAFGGLELDSMQIAYPEFIAAKTTLDLPFGQLPTLQIGHKTYGQSLAIARYVAKLVGLYPSEPLLALQVDAFADAIVEVYNAVFSIFLGSHDETKEGVLLTDTMSNIIPWSLENVHSIVDRLKQCKQLKSYLEASHAQ